MEDLKTRLFRLCSAFGPTGNEQEAAELAAEMLKPLVDEVKILNTATAVGIRKSEDPNAPTILFDAHIDQICLIVTEITPEGFLRFTDIGVDQRMMPGSRVTVRTATGDIPGIVATVPPHLLGKDRTSAFKMNDLLIDVGGLGSRVRIGDFVIFDSEPFSMLGSRVCTKAMDDRACFIACLHMLELLKDKKLNWNLVVCGSSSEESNGKGAAQATYIYEPDFAVVTDVTHARTADAPQVENLLGKGPVIDIGNESEPKTAKRVAELARAAQIPHQFAVHLGRSGTNANDVQASRAGVRTLVISLPLIYMHSPVEVGDMNDIRNLGKLMAEVVMDDEIRRSVK